MVVPLRRLNHQQDLSDRLSQRKKIAKMIIPEEKNVTEKKEDCLLIYYNGPY